MQQMYPFCKLVFASWDFHIVHLEAARLARRALRSQLKEMVSDASLQEIFVPDSAKLVAKLRKVSWQQLPLQAKQASSCPSALPVKDLHAGAVFRLDNLFTKFGEHFENTIQKAVKDTAGALQKPSVRVLSAMWKRGKLSKIVGC